MLKNNLGFPRIGANRELKKAMEAYWAGKVTEGGLHETGREIRLRNWKIQQEAGIDLIPSNDFSFYDQVLDHSFMFGVIPARFDSMKNYPLMTRYFAMARGWQQNGLDLKALQMTKWFDTNYHYMVPEFEANQTFYLAGTKVVDEFLEARAAGIHTKPVLIGPVTYLLLGKVQEGNGKPLDLLDLLLPVYLKLLTKLQEAGADYVQIDEPFLCLDISYAEKEAYRKVFHTIANAIPGLKIILTTYFEGLGSNRLAALNLPVDTLHLDLVQAPDELEAVLAKAGKKLKLSLGVVDGRNIWKTDYTRAIETIKRAEKVLGSERLMISASCSLLHVPVDLALETALDSEIREWMAFATQKLTELSELDLILQEKEEFLVRNQEALERRNSSHKIHSPWVKSRLEAIAAIARNRSSDFAGRAARQKERLNLPLFPTTTIGSFPQTQELRALRRKWKKGELSEEAYLEEIKNEIREAIRWQEQLGLDVLVHGEFERNDMVEYFGELLSGFLFTANGWVQSYGSRCVKPPVIYGDVQRKNPMTVHWAVFAQSLTSKPVKGMLTGPVTIMKWSFVRNDQDLHETRKQISLAIREEVNDLEAAGIGIIQIDEAAFKEAMPLRVSRQQEYIEQSTEAFRIASASVKDETQIHTHMCYSDFKNIAPFIQKMDADVLTIEMSRSQLALRQMFEGFEYGNDLGPGVYDIHSPRVPSVGEMADTLEWFTKTLPAERIWVNPDCGLKTRDWPETRQALENMVAAAKIAREKYQ